MEQQENIYTRTAGLLGNESIEKLKNMNILVVGVGGVGGAVVEMLSRCGVGNLTIIDGDVIKPSNLNRQIIALNTNLNKPKVFEFKKRILDINPLCNVNAINEMVSEEFLLSNTLDFSKFDVVIDCIDSIKDKIALTLYCKQNNVDIVSALGAGNRCGMPNFVMTDIYKTQNDPLARVLRKELRARGISSLTVCVSQEEVKTKSAVVQSIVWEPVAMATVLTAHIINSLL